MKIATAAKTLGYTPTRLIKIVRSHDCPKGLIPANREDPAPINWIFNKAKVISYKEWSESRTGQAAVLTADELNAFLNWQFCNAGQLQRQMGTVIAISHYAGLRISEIASLRLKDVCDKKGNVSRTGLISGFNTKTNKARTIFLGQNRLQEILTSHIRQNALIDPESLLFVTARDKPFTGRYLSERYKSAFKRYGRDDISSHSGRRYFVTEMLSNDVPLKVVQKMAGHSNPMTTALYHEPTESDFEAAINKLS